MAPAVCNTSMVEEEGLLQKRGSLRFEDLGAPIQKLLKETKQCGVESSLLCSCDPSARFVRPPLFLVPPTPLLCSPS